MAIEFIRPKDLPEASEVNENDSIPVDDGSAVGKATPKEIVDAGRPVASQSEAELGTRNDVAMTPLTTAQAIAFDGAGIKSGAEAARDAAEGYRDEAEGFRDSAQGYATSAGTAAGNAQSYASAAQGYRDAAQGYRNQAESYRNAAEDAKELAQAWAESPSAPGDPGTKSAKTWAEEAADSAADASRLLAPDSDVVVRVPSDFPTVQEALDASYPRVYSSNRKVRILIETGHQLTHGWTITGGDWSQFVIESEDPVVRTVQTGFVPVDTSEIPESQRAIAFYKNCIAPVLGTVIRGWSDPAYDGMICFSNVELEVLRDCGVENTRMNFEMRQGGCLSAHGTTWDDALRGCMRLTNGVQFSIAGASFNGAWTSLNGVGGSISSAALRISRGSSGQAQGVIVRDSGARCITVARSFVNLIEAEMANAGLYSGGGVNVGLQIISGSVVTVDDATYNGSAFTEHNFSPAGAVFNMSAGGTGIVFSRTGSVARIRDYLELSDAATAEFSSSPYDTTPGRIQKAGDFGWGATAFTTPGEANDIDDANLPSGVYGVNASTSGDTGPQGTGVVINMVRTPSSRHQLSVRGDSVSSRGVSFRAYSSGQWGAWRSLLGDYNTVVDANGFIKEASPVVRVYADRIEANAEAEDQGVEFERVSEGVYELQGSSGLAQTGWRVEVPADENGNRMIHVSLSESGGIITLEVRSPAWDNGQLVGDAPMDIPAGRWVDIRLYGSRGDENA